MNKLLAVCGPTASGKTALGIKLAKKFSSRGRPASGWKGEIISADSRQVYKGMDIATGKDISNGKWIIDNGKNGYWEIEGIPVWLLDVVKPNQAFSVAQYVDLAEKVIENIWQRNKLPIIVGGTGFYIKGLIDGIETLGVPPDWKLRRRLEKLSVQKLFEMLARLDPGKTALMNASDRKNPRRLVRAIEIANAETQKSAKTQKKIDTLFIGLKALYKELYQRIDKRVNKQVEMGAEQEVKNLLTQGYSWNLPALSGIGYRQWRPYFEKRASLEEVVQRWKYDEHAYARRQMSWFRRDKRIRWFDIAKPGFEKKVEKLVNDWYTKN